jgi:putative ABC transport system permease protein
MVAAIWMDLRYALRALLKQPSFTLLIVVTLALGIGATTALFSIVYGVLLRQLPYGDEKRIVAVWQSNLKNGVEREDTSPANFFDWRERTQSLDLAAAEPFGHALTGHGEPEAFRSWAVTSGFFELLGASPLYGRTFLPEEYQPGRASVIVIGHGLWKRRFGGDPNLVGQQLILNSQPHTVVGIMPPGFQYPLGREVWAPRTPRNYDRTARGTSYIRVVGRLRPGQTLGRAQAEMNVIAAQLSQEHPQTNADIGMAIAPLREALVGQARRGLLILFGAVGFVLLIACANVASLLLVRASERSREFAIRAALGAGRFRLIRQSLVESILLALVGGAGGTLLSGWLIDAILAFSLRQLPHLISVDLNATTLVFALGVSILTALIFGLAPALRVARAELQDALRSEGRTMTAGRERQQFRNMLVVSEIALALVLAVGAGLLIRSFVALLRVNPGFVTEHALTLETQFGRNRTPVQIAAFVEDALGRVATIPGVEMAGLASALPFHDNQVTLPTSVRIEGRVSPPGQDPTAYKINASPDYLSALGVPLLRGRLISRFDKADTAPVVLINQTMAARHWPLEDPLGRKITFSSLGTTMTCEIVGIVGDIRPQGLDSEPRPEIYTPFAQSPIGSITWLVRTSGEPYDFLQAVKEKIREINPNQTFASIASMEELVDRSMSQRRFNLFLLGSFAFLALGLASVGLYGLMSSLTAQRTHEIGVRMALGAQTRDVMRLIIREGMTLALAGVGLGLLGALTLTRLMSSLLYHVGAYDPLTFTGIASLLVGVAFIACYLPARRATRVDPMMALREF